MKYLFLQIDIKWITRIIIILLGIAYYRKWGARPWCKLWHDVQRCLTTLLTRYRHCTKGDYQSVSSSFVMCGWYSIIIERKLKLFFKKDNQFYCWNNMWSWFYTNVCKTLALDQILFGRYTILQYLNTILILLLVFPNVNR